MTNRELKDRLEQVRKFFNASLKICRSSEFEQVATDGGFYINTDLCDMNMIMCTTDYNHEEDNCTDGRLIIDGWLVFVRNPVKDSLEMMSKVIGATRKLYDGQMEIGTCLFDLPAELAVEHQYNVSIVALRVSLRSNLKDQNCYTICDE